MSARHQLPQRQHLDQDQGLGQMRGLGQRRGLEQVLRLEADSFALEPIRGEDAPRLQALADDDQFQRWLPWIRGGYTKNRAAEFATDFSTKNWASGQPVWGLRADGHLVGVIDLRDRGENAWEVGFWMHPDARGKGMMTQACALAVEAAFTHLGALRILHYAEVGNTRSLRVARNLGFRPEGVRRKLTATGVEKQWQSALLKSDWLSRQGPAVPAVVSPEVLDGARPSELAAELALTLGAGTDLHPAAALGVGEAERLAALVLSTYELAAQANIDLEKALRRGHASRLSQNRPGREAIKMVKKPGLSEPGTTEGGGQTRA